MTEPAMPPEVAAEWMKEEARHTDAFVAFVRSWPQFRKHAASALLGSAVATADLMGVDAEAFIRDLRARYPKPSSMRPPEQQ